MIARLLELPKNRSLFLFGLRGAGKSTLVEQQFSKKHCYWIDLLDAELEDRYSRAPQELAAIVDALPNNISHIIIDEIQKIPKLLDVVHSLIKKTNKKFILTGSSARKLKYGGANLLAGRAFVYNLFPFSFLELDNNFNLQQALTWGMLPEAVLLNEANDKRQYLMSYALTYLKEEIWGEQLIRKLNPFRKFLEVSAQSNGKIINYSNIARDVGVDDKTVKEYFSILEDTLVGTYLEPFHHSFRKRLSQKPKFYYFDTGIVKALSRSLSLPLNIGTSYYGELFEHFIIVECIKLINYSYPDYKYSYLYTKDGAEIDLIVERPGEKILFIKIKSSTNVYKTDLTKFIQLTNDFGSCEAICLSNDAELKQYDNVTVYPWRAGISKYFSNSQSHNMNK